MIEWINFATKRPDITLCDILIWTKYNNVFSAYYNVAYDEVYIVTGFSQWEIERTKIENDKIIAWAYINGPDFDWLEGRT